MPYVEHVFLKPGRYRFGNRVEEVSAAALGKYARDTQAALDDPTFSGVPVIPQHLAPGAPSDGRQFDEACSALGVLGWLDKVWQNPDGSLSYRLDVDEEAAEAIRKGRVRFTSPELRENWIDGGNRPRGSIIRHVAFTPTPRNPDQTRLAPAQFSEDSGRVLQFSLDDLEEAVTVAASTGKSKPKPPQAPKKPPTAAPKKPKFAVAQYADDDNEEDGEGDEGMEALDLDALGAPPEPPPATEPATAADPQLLQLVREFATTVGATIPGDFDPMTPEGLRLLLVAAMNRMAGEKAAQTKAPDGDSPPAKPEEETMIETGNSGMQYSEDPIVSDLQRKVADLSGKLAAERSAVARRAEIDGIRARKIDPGLKRVLIDAAGALQFSETGAPKTYTPGEVAALLEKHLPPVLRFSEDKAAVERHPQGDEFLAGTGAEPSDEDYDRRAEEQLARYRGRPVKAAS